MNILYAAGLAAFAVFTIWLNWDYRKFLNTMSPEDRKAYREEAHRDLAVW